MKNDLKLPYRSYVETKRDDPVFQGLLAAWKTVTFKPTALYESETKETGFYETILFDLLYQGEDVETISGTINKKVKSFQASTLKSLVNFIAGEEKNWKRNLSELTEEQYADLTKDLEMYDGLKNVFGAIGSVSKVLSYANTVEELVYKLAKAQVIMQRTDQTSKILMNMRANAKNNSMHMALDNICSDEVSEETVTAIFVAEKRIDELLKHTFNSIWGSVMKDCKLYGLTILA